jgi:hypothetical protein
VVSQSESRALVRDALANRTPNPAALSTHLGLGNRGVESRLDALLKAVEGRRALVAPSSFTLNTQSPVQDAVALQLEQLRAMVRVGGL